MISAAGGSMPAKDFMMRPPADAVEADFDELASVFGPQPADDESTNEEKL